MSRILDHPRLLSWRGVSFAGWSIWRVGYPSRLYPPTKRGRWWLWVGPYFIGKPDDTW